MTTVFALFAEVERDLISERTREGLARARSSGRKLGRPKGSLGVSRLDGKEDEIRRFLELGVSKTAIAKLTGVSRTEASGRGPSVYFHTNVVGTLETQVLADAPLMCGDRLLPAGVGVDHCPGRLTWRVPAAAHPLPPLASPCVPPGTVAAVSAVASVENRDSGEDGASSSGSGRARIPRCDGRCR